MAASRLRGPSDPPVRLVSKVGGDINGNALLAELAADGVDTSWCARLTLTLTLTLSLILTLTLTLSLILTLTLTLTLTPNPNPNPDPDP